MIFLCDYKITKQCFLIGGYLLSRASFEGPPYPAVARYFHFDIMANLTLVYWIKFIKFMCDYDITHDNKENTCIVFFIWGYTLLSSVVGIQPFSAAARCVYVHILLFFMATILLVNWIKLIKMWLWHNKENTCSVRSIGGWTLLSHVVGGSRFSQW